MYQGELPCWCTPGSWSCSQTAGHLPLLVPIWKWVRLQQWSPSLHKGLWWAPPLRKGIKGCEEWKAGRGLWGEERVIDDWLNSLIFCSYQSKDYCEIITQYGLIYQSLFTSHLDITAVTAVRSAIVTHYGSMWTAEWCQCHIPPDFCPFPSLLVKSLFY